MKEAPNQFIDTWETGHGTEYVLKVENSRRIISTAMGQIAVRTYDSSILDLSKFSEAQVAEIKALRVPEDMPDVVFLGGQCSVEIPLSRKYENEKEALTDGNIEKFKQLIGGRSQGDKSVSDTKVVRVRTDGDGKPTAIEFQILPRSMPNPHHEMLMAVADGRVASTHDPVAQQENFMKRYRTEDQDRAALCARVERVGGVLGLAGPSAKADA